MTTDSNQPNSMDIDRDEFCSFIGDLIKSSLPLSLFHFAFDLDNALSHLLPNRDDHIAAIVEQAFKISIKPAQLRHYLLIFKKAADNDILNIWHKKNINNELNEYAKKKIEHVTDMSQQFCTSIQIEPANMTCPNCSVPFKSSSVKAKIVSTFCIDGQVKKATIYSYKCVNKISGCNIDAYPNFYTCNQGVSRHGGFNDSYRITYPQMFQHSEFIYLGGDYAFEKKVLDNMSNMLYIGHVAFSSFVRIYNRLSTTPPNPLLERRLFERIFLVYSMIQFEFFMGNNHAFVPRHLKVQLDDYIDLHLDRWYTEFVQFWGNHSSLKPCTTKCTNAIIIDGHMKLRRRLCYNQSLSLIPPKPFQLVFDAITVGCPETPSYNSKICLKCASSSAGSMGAIEKGNRSTVKQANSLADLSCNVDKENHVFADGYLRSSGVLLIATNCQIVIGFAEILRSESKKEVVQALAHTFNLAPALPRFVVYDAGCLLVKFIKANFDNPNRINSIYVTTETRILHNEIKWMIDRFHLQNHVDNFCHTELNPDRDPAMKDVNTSSCEQLNAWLKGFSHILSNMNKTRFRATLLTVVHLRNCEQINISFRTLKARDVSYLQSTNCTKLMGSNNTGSDIDSDPEDTDKYCHDMEK